jgi:hypothetical protein
MIGNPTYVFYQISVYMQCWRAMVRQKDRSLLDEAVVAVRRLHARTRA